MNVKRFIARSSREALNQVRMAFGADAVVLSNKPCDAGVEVLAMAPEGIAQIEQVAAVAPREIAPASRCAGQAGRTSAGRAGRAATGDEHAVVPGLCARAPVAPPPGRHAARGARDRDAHLRRAPCAAGRWHRARRRASRRNRCRCAAPVPVQEPIAARAPLAATPSMQVAVPAAREPLRLPESVPSLADPTSAQREQAAVMNELRSMSRA